MTLLVFHTLLLQLDGKSIEQFLRRRWKFIMLLYPAPTASASHRFCTRRNGTRETLLCSPFSPSAFSCSWDHLHHNTPAQQKCPWVLPLCGGRKTGEKHPEQSAILRIQSAGQSKNLYFPRTYYPLPVGPLQNETWNIGVAITVNLNFNSKTCSSLLLSPGLYNKTDLSSCLLPEERLYALI